MSMDYIRRYYGVPAKRGGRVTYTGGRTPTEGTIVASDGQYLKIRLAGDSRPGRFHPTWELAYLTAEPETSLLPSDSSVGGSDA